jgi:hypothetical protein
VPAIILVASVPDFCYYNYIANQIETAWGCTLKKQPISYRIDFAGVRNNEIRCWVEVKSRDCESTRYPTLMLSVNKWVSGLNLARITGLPFVLAVGFADCIKYLRCNPNEIPQVAYKWGGRTRKPRDSADIEPVVHIPLKFFKTLK